MSIPFKTTTPAASEFHVAPGEYRLRVVDAREDTSKGGNDMIKLKLRVLKDDGSEGVSLFDYLVFTESTHWKINHFLKSCGKHPGDNEDVDLYPDEMIGWECEATLIVEEFDGKKSNKVSAYLWDDVF